MRVAVTPPEAALKPGLTQAYVLEGSNMGNQTSSMTLGLAFHDSNQVGCGLANLGSGPGCPERAWPTRIDPGSWTNAATLAGRVRPPRAAGRRHGRL